MNKHTLSVCFLLLVAWAGAAQGRSQLDRPARRANVQDSPHNEIPQRCIDKSVSNVTCSQVGEDRLLPHPDDCQLFYYCVGEQPICRECPADLHFNPSKHVCDSAARAGCTRPPIAESEDTILDSVQVQE